MSMLEIKEDFLFNIIIIFWPELLNSILESNLIKRGSLILKCRTFFFAISAEI